MFIFKRFLSPGLRSAGFCCQLSETKNVHSTYAFDAGADKQILCKRSQKREYFNSLTIWKSILSFCA